MSDVYIGANPIDAAYLGSTALDAIYLGSTQIWPSGPPPSFYSDNFNRANGTLTTPWVNDEGTHSIVSNAVPVGTASPTVSYYNDTFTDDQWSEVYVTGLVSNGSTIVPCVRVTGSVGDFYYAWCDSSFIASLIKRVGGSYNVVSGGTLSIQDTTVAIAVSGSTIKVYVDGVEDISATDPDITTGKPGIISANGSGATADNWRGGSGAYPGPP